MSAPEVTAGAVERAAREYTWEHLPAGMLRRAVHRRALAAALDVEEMARVMRQVSGRSPEELLELATAVRAAILGEA